MEERESNWPPELAEKYKRLVDTTTLFAVLSPFSCCLTLSFLTLGHDVAEESLFMYYLGWAIPSLAVMVFTWIMCVQQRPFLAATGISETGQQLRTVGLIVLAAATSVSGFLAPMLIAYYGYRFNKRAIDAHRDSFVQGGYPRSPDQLV